MVDGAPLSAKVSVAETTWLEDIASVEWRDIEGGKLLMYTLRNGHRYAIALTGQALALTQNAVSRVAVAKALPGNNGHSAH